MNYIDFPLSKQSTVSIESRKHWYTMFYRLILTLAFMACVAESFTTTTATTRLAFVPRTTSTSVVSLTELAACRTNAKKEKIKRNRENMRKFKTGGKKGLTRRKLLKKAQSSRARQEEAEFIAKCYITVPIVEEAASTSGKK